jgi:hypothetical protein
MTTFATGLQPSRTAAVAAAVGFIAIAAFQLALALGAPLGRAAWGGAHLHLPTSLRIASAFAVGVWVLAALIILGRARYPVSPLPLGAGCPDPGRAVPRGRAQSGPLTVAYGRDVDL